MQALLLIAALALGAPLEEAERLNQQVLDHFAAGELDEALPKCERVLAVREAELDSGDELLEMAAPNRVVILFEVAKRSGAPKAGRTRSPGAWRDSTASSARCMPRPCRPN